MHSSIRANGLLRTVARPGRLRSCEAQPSLSCPSRSFHKATRIPSVTASQARKRPTVNDECQRTHTFAPIPSMPARTIFIQTQSTPNTDALKFVPNHPVLPDNFPTTSVEYTSPRSTLAPPYPSQLASRLLNVDGVSSIFYGPDFITVTKSADTNWAHVKPEVFSLITEAVTAGEQIVQISSEKSDASQVGMHNTLAADDEDDEVVAMIKELLETRIRPAIQEDGGDIDFRGFDPDSGTVKLKLRGACRTCDSSTVTLKNGIESMLMHYIEEVKTVEQVLDEEELIAQAEFEKFEAKLKEMKGPDAVAKTHGKGSLDYAE